MTEQTKVKVDPTINQWKDEFAAVRKDFHQHPEIGLETKRTSKKIAEMLRSFGVDEVHEKIGGWGVVGVIKGKKESPYTIGLRADIDALPLQELSKHDHISKTDGSMHACGHDGHAATLLMVAKYLTGTRNFAGKAVLIFQPGEEGWAGAKHMLDDGLLEKFPVNEIYAYHNSHQVPYGEVVLNYGAMQAAADIIKIKVCGKGGHGSRPQMSNDPILAAAHIIVALQTIVSRNVDPNLTGVVSCCSIHAGDPRAQSVIPESCEIVGTTRTYNPQIRDLIEKRVHEIAEGVAGSLGCKAEVEYIRFYPPCINSKEQAAAVADIAAEIVGEKNVNRDYPRMPGGEDFAFMLEKVPGAYFRVGQGGNATHSPYFDFNDEIMPLAATAMARIVEKRLAHLNAK